MLFIIDNEDRKQDAIAYLQSIQSFYPPMQVDVREYKKNRSSSQNRLMWMWYTIIADHIGEERETLHEMMKVRVLGVEHKHIQGHYLTIPRSTTRLDTRGMSMFLAAIEALGNELGVKLPIPDDYAYAMHKEKRV